jgi:hypothetical protein
VRIAVVGAYGAGKTTLSRALSRITGWPVVPVGPMADPVRGRPLPLERCSLAQTFQLTLRRHEERVRGEAVLGAAFISDGSVLHEWVYLLTLARWTLRRPTGDGRHPDERRQAAAVGRLAACALAEMGQQMGHRYDLVVRVPVEHTLPSGAPITVEFQRQLDSITAAVLARIGARLVRAEGTTTARARAVVSSVVVTPGG